MSGSNCHWEGILTEAKFSAPSIAVSGSSFCVHRQPERSRNYPAADGQVFGSVTVVSTTGGCHVEILDQSRLSSREFPVRNRQRRAPSLPVHYEAHRGYRCPSA